MSILQLDAIFKDPNCIYVDAALQAQEYLELTIHDEKILLKHTSCSPEELQRTLQLLQDNGIISFDGSTIQAWIIFPSLFLEVQKFDFLINILPKKPTRSILSSPWIQKK